MNKPVPNTLLEHASVGALRSCVLHDNPDIKTTDDIPSVDIVRMCFGIAVGTPSQVEIMSNVINAVGGMRDSLIAVLRDKFAVGPLWEFTTDFGVTVALTKIQHKDGINPLRLTMKKKLHNGSTEYRPLVEFTSGACKFFTTDDIEVGPVPSTPEGFTFTTDTVKKESNEPVQTIPEETAAEAEPGPSTEALQDEPDTQAETGEVDTPENSGLTSVEDLEPAEPETSPYLPAETAVSVDGISRVRTMNKIHEATAKIIASGKATMELIDELIRPNVPKYNIGFEYKNNTVYVKLSEKSIEPPKPAPAPVKEPTPPTKEEIEAERKVKEDLNTLMTAEKTLCEEFEKCNAYDQVKLLQDFQAKIKAIDPVVRKELFSKNYPELAASLANRFKDLTLRANENLKAQIEKDKVKVEEAIAEEQEAAQEEITISVEEAPNPPEVELATQHAEEIAEQMPDADPKVNEETASAQASLIAEIASGAAEAEVKLNQEPEQKENTEMIVRIDCPAAIPNEDYEKIKAKIAELYDPNGNELTDAEKTKLITADLGYECTLVTIKAGEEYVVTIPIEDENEERSEEEQLQESMQSDKKGEQQWLDLSDASVREPFIQVLFPGISYPSYMHLMTFLKKFHTEEQTKTYIATKGSIPTETTIVYDNVTFCIVKMKESRFYRIFIANTDYSLQEHGWCETNFMPNRWFRLGQDIHNPCFQNEGIIENRGGFHRGYGR